MNIYCGEVMGTVRFSDVRKTVCLGIVRVRFAYGTPGLKFDRLTSFSKDSLIFYIQLQDLNQTFGGIESDF